MNTAAQNTVTTPKNSVSVGMAILIAVVSSVLAVCLVLWLLLPHAITPVVLNNAEQATLATKLKSLHLDLAASARKEPHNAKTQNRVLMPEKYTEEGASRQVTFTEREMNALIATNTDLADKVAIDLSPGLVSARAVIPLDPDMPLFGGKTLKISGGLEFSYQHGRPVVILKGVSLWGVPIPNAWLGDLKNIDLVTEYGDAGFWKDFAAGVDNIEVGDGTLAVRLKE